MLLFEDVKFMTDIVCEKGNSICKTLFSWKSTWHLYHWVRRWSRKVEQNKKPRRWLKRFLHMSIIPDVKCAHASPTCIFLEGCWWVFLLIKRQSVNNWGFKGCAWTRTMRWRRPTVVSPETPTTWSTRIFIARSGASPVSPIAYEGVSLQITCSARRKTPSVHRQAPCCHRRES